MAILSVWLLMVGFPKRSLVCFPLFFLSSQTRIKGGLMYDSRSLSTWVLGSGPIPQTITPQPLVRDSALGPLGHEPQHHATMPDPMPIGIVILTQTHFEAQLGPPPINCKLDGSMVTQWYHVSATRHCLGECLCRTVFLK